MNTRVYFVVIGLYVATLACAIPFVSQDSAVSGSGDIVTVEGSVTDFDSLDINHSFNVDIIQSQTSSAIVRVDDNIEQYLIFEQRGNTLVLDLEDGREYINITLEAQISIPSLSSLDVSGASDAKFTQFQSAEPFDLRASGASTAEGDIEAGDVTIDLSGSSDIQLAGSGNNLNLNISGSSRADLEEFSVNDANLDIGGSSDVIVNASGTLNVTASGASDIIYVGSPTLGKIETSGSSSIQGQ